MDKNATCTGCACLCDDIEIKSGNSSGFEVLNACIKGTVIIEKSKNYMRRTKYRIKEKEVSREVAFEEAIDRLGNARKAIIFGLDNSTLEAQTMAIALARKLKVAIDDYSSFSYGPLVEIILRGGVPTCDLSMANSCDMILYWGSNPHHSHPRHISHFTYYSQEEFCETGWIPKVCLSCVEVRDTELSRICDQVFRILPGGDRKFIEAVLDTLNGKSSSNTVGKFIKSVQKSKVTIIFVGLALIHSLEGDLGLFVEMIKELNKINSVYTIPMIGPFNMRGFNQQLFEATDRINQVSFETGNAASDKQFSFLEQIHNNNIDCALIIGSDLAQDLPSFLVKKLLKIPIISLDPSLTITTAAADVSIPVAIPGVESGGSAIRMDGKRVNFCEIKEDHEYPSEEDVLRYFFESI